MPTQIPSLFSIVVFFAGLIVFLDAFERITQQFCKRTPFTIRAGMVLMAAGALAFLYNPLMLGGCFLIGRALLLIGGRQARFTFLSRKNEHP